MEQSEKESSFFSKGGKKKKKMYKSLTAVELFDERRDGTPIELIRGLANGRRLGRPLFLDEHLGEPEHLAVADQGIAIQPPIVL